MCSAHLSPIGQFSPANMQMRERHFLSSCTPCFTAKREKDGVLRLHTQKNFTPNRGRVHSLTNYMYDDRFAKFYISLAFVIQYNVAVHSARALVTPEEFSTGENKRPSTQCELGAPCQDVQGRYLRKTIRVYENSYVHCTRCKCLLLFVTLTLLS